MLSFSITLSDRGAVLLSLLLSLFLLWLPLSLWWCVETSEPSLHPSSVHCFAFLSVLYGATFGGDRDHTEPCRLHNGGKMLMCEEERSGAVFSDVKRLVGFQSLALCKSQLSQVMHPIVSEKHHPVGLHHLAKVLESRHHLVWVYRRQNKDEQSKVNLSLSNVVTELFLGNVTTKCGTSAAGVQRMTFDKVHRAGRKVTSIKAQVRISLHEREHGITNTTPNLQNICGTLSKFCKLRIQVVPILEKIGLVHFVE
mmetsp:Transcript_21416/g.46673  ORF Transcript_21416/g.46673 Transcript_21416/m.46673 type:complete len:254 (-) Transcript_21416:379-1140(-)